ncbi:hypothetical protein V0M98_34760 (plasmid) [Pseudomonas silesiensis]|uniref:hypothetical protein n=1 Tax=Pseudomonas silesiensis TaxID=1853130 RepID=UPI0030D3635C
MTTRSDASFARTLTERLSQEFPGLAITCKGGRVGVGNMRVMKLTVEGGQTFQFPFPSLGTHTEAVNQELLSMARNQVQFLIGQKSKAQSQGAAS